VTKWDGRQVVRHGTILAMLLLIFVIVLAYSLSRSGKRALTLAFVLVWSLVAFAAYFVIAYFFKLPGAVAGEAGLYASLLCGMLAALVHSRRNKSLQKA
jgi:small-conductance mechanosensitive channel